MPDNLTRAAPLANSFDPATRRCTAVIATEAAVQRRDARGPYLEILPLDAFTPSSGTITLLDSHRNASVRDSLGRVLSIVRESDALVATLELSSAEDVVPVGQRIADGTLTGVSIGYRVSGWQEQTTPAGRVKRATGFTITEVTLTSNPADPSARIRQEESPMPPEVIETTPAPDPGESRSLRPYADPPQHDPDHPQPHPGER